MTIEWLRDVAPAAWIAPRLHPFARDVGAVVPADHEAYARVFHGSPLPSVFPTAPARRPRRSWIASAPTLEDRWTYVAGTSSLVAAIAADPDLKVTLVRPTGRLFPVEGQDDRV